MRISDWSSDVCSSELLAVNPPSARAIGRKSTDRVNGGPRHPYHRRRTRGLRSRLAARRGGLPRPTVRNARRRGHDPRASGRCARRKGLLAQLSQSRRRERKSVVQGRSVSVLVDIGCSRNIKKTRKENNENRRNQES